MQIYIYSTKFASTHDIMNMTLLGISCYVPAWHKFHKINGVKYNAQVNSTQLQVNRSWKLGIHWQDS